MTPQERKVMELALEALKDARALLNGHHGTTKWFAKEITAIKEALAQPEQEPVGKLVSDEFDGHRFISYQNEWPFNVDLYAATPPQHALMAEHWKAEYDKLKAACKPLTDTQLRKLWAQYASKVNGWPNDATPPMVNIGNGPRFQVDWHESEYRIFRAGFEASRGIKE